VLTSISFSVKAKHCLSGSCVWLNEQDRQRPPKPMSSRISLSAPFESAVVNLGFDDRLWNKSCAASNVDVFWQCSRTSSSI
jgi:hypothetical protein